MNEKSMKARKLLKEKKMKKKNWNLGFVRYRNTFGWKFHGL